MERFGPFLLEARLDGGGKFEIWRASRADDPYRGEARQCVVLRIAEAAAQRRWPAWADPAVAKQLRHRTVVRMLEDGSSNGRRWFSFEHVDGVDLRQLLHGGAVPRNVALAITHDLVDALAAASHVVGGNGRPFELVHGSIAPRWVLVSRLGDVKLGGFGIGYLKPERRSGYDESIWSPERLLGVPDATAQSDLFQVGLVLHRLLVGVDYVSQAQARIMEAVTRRNVARSVLPEIEPRLDTFLRLLLAERPQDRFATPARAMEALAAITADGPDVRSWLASRT